MKRNKEQIEYLEHYTKGGIETWDYIVSWDMGYLDGNVIKYVTRYRFKNNPMQDLYKAKQYIEKLIEVENEKRIKEG